MSNQIAILGVYTWANNISARVTFLMGEIIYEMPLIFPEDDFRKEYNGSVKNGCVLHGEGTLHLKNGLTFFGEWVNGCLEGQ